MKIYAHAKINLSLDVCGRRPDGYHEVRMIMQSLSLSDEIELKPRGDGEIRMTMEPANDGTMLRTAQASVFADIPTDERNLMVRAARLIKEHCGIASGVDMHLIKRIPSQAGLGGGSSDAAAVLKEMNRLFEAGLTEEELRALGLKLGADVPFCIMGGTALAEGIGERLTPLRTAAAFDRLPVLLVKPVRGVSTGRMYAALDTEPGLRHPDTDACLKALAEGDLPAFAASASNSFSLPVERDIPVIGRITEDMRREGAFFSCMSGSGPTVFGLFRDPGAAGAAAERIRTAIYAEELSDIITASFVPTVQE